MSTSAPTPTQEPECTATARDGASVRIARHGGHVCGWRTADGIERLYLSPLPRQGEAPIRGGIPIVFPQFGDRGPLPMHGFVRTLPWECGAATPLPDGRGRLALGLADTPATRAIWPHPFRLELNVTVGGAALEVELVVHNTGGAPFEFRCALHTYFAVRGYGARVGGLERRPFIDNMDGSHGLDADGGPVVIDRAIGRIYPEVTDALTIADGDDRMRIEHTGFRDVVVWNPGEHPRNPPPDLPPDGYRQFVCVEGAVIGHPVQLAPGATWTGTQRLRG